MSKDDLPAAYEPSTSIPEDPSQAQTCASNDTPATAFIPNHSNQGYTVPDSDPDVVTTLTHIQCQHENIQLNHNIAVDGQLAQAERIVKRSRVEHVAGNPGDNVIIPIPLVDRGKGDLRNII